MTVPGWRRDAADGSLTLQIGVAQRHVTLLRGESGGKKLVRIEAPTRRPESEWG